MKLLKNIIAKLTFWYKYKKETFSLNTIQLTKKHRLSLVTVSFNNAEIIKLQYQIIKKNLRDDFLYIIADNSNLESESSKISSWAKENNLVYFKLPPNPYSGINPSRSHGLALNFISKKVLRLSNCDYLGFIDQDIFPTPEVSLIKKIGDLPYYGLIQDRGDKQYLWPGFCFFNRAFFVNQKINFLPIKGLDTGGGNYKIYKKDILDRLLLEHYYIRVDTGEKTEITYNGIQQDCVEFIDGWIHLMSSSNWNQDINKNKISNIINKYDLLKF